MFSYQPGNHSFPSLPTESMVTPTLGWKEKSRLESCKARRAYDLRVPSNLLRFPHTDVLICITMSMSAVSNPLSPWHTEWSLKYRSNSRIPLLKTFQGLKEIRPPHHGLQHPDGCSLPSLPPHGTFPFLFLTGMTLTYFPFLRMAKLFPPQDLLLLQSPLPGKILPSDYMANFFSLLLLTTSPQRLSSNTIPFGSPSLC